jgi:4-carboxymuconolactone decarboxylase
VATSEQRRRRGEAILKRISGGTGGPILAPLGEIARDFPSYILEFVFGDIFSRRPLDLKSREIAAVAALAAIGDTDRQLRVHIGNALKTGCTRAEVVEVLIQTAVFAGFPRAMNALFTARDVFAELDRRVSRKASGSGRQRRTDSRR